MQRFFKILACERFHNFCVDNIPEDEYFEIHTKFHQCPHDKESHKHVFVPCDSCRFNFNADLEFFPLHTNVFAKHFPKTQNFFLCSFKNGINIRLLKICMSKEIFPVKHFSCIELNEYLKSFPGDGFFILI